MSEAQLAQGTVQYRVSGPADSAAPPVVFVHGFLVDGRLWRGVGDLLAEAGVRSYAPDWPLGSHRTPMPPDTDLSPRGVARLIVDFLAALDLRDVTLVGCDTGGALCQLVLDTDASRIGRVVFTNCDAFESFPPRLFVPLFIAARSAVVTRSLLAPMRVRAVRHSVLGFGPLMRRPIDAELTLSWLAPAMADPRIRADIARFARGMDRGALVELAPRLADFPGPVRVVWGTDDRNFSPKLGRRLAGAFADAEFVEVPGATTFVSIDRADAVAEAITTLARTGR